MKRRAAYFCTILALLICVPVGSVFIAKSVSEHALSAGRSVGAVAKKYIHDILPSKEDRSEESDESVGVMAEMSLDDTPCLSPDGEKHLCLAGIFTKNEGALGLCSVMVVSMDKKDGRMSVADLPTDIKIAQSENAPQSPNEFFAGLGESDPQKAVGELCKFMGEELGVSFDGYFFIYDKALPSVVDALGGVKIKLPKELYSPLADEGILFEKGKHVFDGNDSARALESPDAEDVRLCSKLLFAIGDRIRKQSDLPSLLNLRRAVSAHLVSDLTLSKTLCLAPTFMRGISHKTEVLVIPSGENAKNELAQWLD